MSFKKRSNQPRAAAPTRCALLVATALSLTLIAPAYAQTDDAGDDAAYDTIVVTAAKREQRLIDVATSITNVGEEDIIRSGAADIASISTRIAGLNFSRRGPSQNQISLRGLTNTVGADTEFPMIGFYVDETPLPDTNVPDVAFADLARVEVLRGPQGTVYGESSMGGTVKLVTNKPDLSAFSGRATAEVSTTEDGGASYEGSAVVNVPLVQDVAALRVVGTYQDDGGFIDNAATGEKDADAFDRYSVRATLLVEPTDRLSLTASATYQELDQGLDSFIFPDDDRIITQSLATGFSETSVFRQSDTFAEEELFLASFVAEYEFDGFTLTSATGYYDRDFNRAGDQPNAAIQFEASPAVQGLSLALAGEPFVVTNGIPTTRLAEQEVFTQEVRLTSTGDSPLQWIVGAYYRDRETIASTATSAPDFVPLVTIFTPDYTGNVQSVTEDVGYEQISVFGELQYSLTDQLTLIGGLRWFEETFTGQQTSTAANLTAIDPNTGFPIPGEFGADIVGIGERVESTENKVLGRVGASFAPTDNSLIYATVAQGFRPGGINTRADLNASEAQSPRAYDSDEVLTYELGGKTTFAGGDGFVNIAGFFTEASDLQFRDDTDPIFNVIRNAGEAEILGAELEVAYSITQDLNVGFNVTVQESEFVENALQRSDGVFLIEDGQRIPIARDLTLGAYVDYRRPITSDLDFTFYGDLTHVGDAVSGTTRTDIDPTAAFITLNSYTLLNTRFGIENDRWSLTAFVENLTDEFAEQGGNSTFGINRNKPRTYGVIAAVNF